MYIPPENSLHNDIDMFTDIEDTIVSVNLHHVQVCLLGDFNAHTGIGHDYIDIDDHILNNCNISNDDQALINSSHVLKNIMRLVQGIHKTKVKLIDMENVY